MATNTCFFKGADVLQALLRGLGRVPDRRRRSVAWSLSPFPLEQILARVARVVGASL